MDYLFRPVPPPPPDDFLQIICKSKHLCYVWGFSAGVLYFFEKISAIPCILHNSAKVVYTFPQVRLYRDGTARVLFQGLFPRRAWERVAPEKA